MAVVVSINSRYGVTLEECLRKQSNKTKLAMLLHFKSHLKRLYISNKTEHFSYKGDFDLHSTFNYGTLQLSVKIVSAHGHHTINNDYAWYNIYSI